jgi:aryl-alcohol dehydrogenase-like predicted oxidoreductase
MEYRRFGRSDWKVSEIGYGMWGLAGWTGSDDNEVALSLETFLTRHGAMARGKVNKFWAIF